MGERLYRKNLITGAFDSVTDAEVLAEMGGERMWLCVPNRTWLAFRCRHTRQGCSAGWIVKEAADG